MLAGHHILLVGCGNMGGALLRGWLQEREVRVTAVTASTKSARHLRSIYDDDDRLRVFAEEECLGLISDLSLFQGAPAPDLIVFAVKPQIIADVLPRYASFYNLSSTTFCSSLLLLSVAAGVRLDQLASRLGVEGAPIVRAMPNMPAAIGKGVSVAVANPHLAQGQKALAHAALEAVGKCYWLDDESHINAATALSGSGPAYIFYLAECLAQAGQRLGLSEGQSQNLAREMIIGAGAMLEQRPESSPDALRRSVTSPSGTTEAALSVLADGGPSSLQSLFDRAFAAAVKRAEELALGVD